MKRIAIALGAFVAFAAVTAAQVTIPYTFTPNTDILSSEVNANFAALGSKAVNREGGTVTGTLTSSGGSISGTWSGNPTFSGNVLFTGSGIFDQNALALRDTDSSHVLLINAGDDLSGDETLTLKLGGSDREIEIDGDGTLALKEEGLEQFGVTLSADLAGIISDETGTGALVFATSPTLTTPTLGVASATSLQTSGNVVVGDDIVGGASFDIRLATSDSSDNGRLALGGGGDVGTTRGATLTLFGNEHTNTGDIKYRVGNTTGANHEFYRVGDVLAMSIDGDTGAVAMLGTATVNGNFGVGGLITAGSGNVQLTNANGNLLASALTGTIASSVQDNITRLGTVTSGTFSGTLGAISGANLTNLNASNLATGSVPAARLPTSGTWTLSSLLALTGGAVGIDELTMPGVIDATVSAATDDWEPTGIAGASVIRVTGSGGSWNVTGIAAPAVDFKVLVLTGVASNGISLLNENSGSEAENRILTPGGNTVTVSNGSSAILWYDSSSDRWRVFGWTQ